MNQTTGIEWLDTITTQELMDQLNSMPYIRPTKSINHSHVKDKMRRKGITFPTWSVLPYDHCTQMINGTRIFTTLNGLHNASAKN